MGSRAVLIVEDESVIALNIAHVIESFGYRPVGPVATGTDALDLLAREPIDLVLLDVKLKGAMDGIELARRINAGRPMPIVFLTAYTDSRTLARARVTEPYGYITKSFDEGELHSTIETALYRFETEQKLVRQERLLAATLGAILEGVVTTDHDGTIRYMNPAAVRLIGVPFEEARGRTLDSIVTVRGGDGERVYPSTLAASGEPDEPSAVYRIEVAGQAATPVEWKTARICAADNRDAETVHVVRDLTTRYRADATQLRLVSLVESSDDAIITLSPQGSIESWNSGAEKVFGYTAGEAINCELSLIASRFAPFDIVEAVRRTGEGENVEPLEIACIRKDGSPVDVAVKFQGIRDLTGLIGSVSLIARDVTVRKNLDKKLREILHREQTRIGQDLHDSIGQMITGVLLKSKVLEQRLVSRTLSEEAGEISEIKSLLTETLLKLRELARGLIPATILSEGLVPALVRLAHDTESVSGIEIAVSADPDSEPSDELVNAEVYHIVEEALTNALKHSSCRRVAITLKRSAGELAVSVHDDGRGVPTNAAGNGLGLRIMRHRAELIGAHLSVRNTGEGTEVLCRVSMAAAEGREAP